MKDMIMELQLMHETIWSSVGMLMLFALCSGYLVYRYRKNEESVNLYWLFLYIIVTAVLACANPILAKILLRMTGDEYTFIRFIWLVPAFPLMAYAFMQLILSIPAKRRSVAAIVLVTVIICCGNFWPQVYRKAENPYKISQNLLDACELIRSDAGLHAEPNVNGHITVNLQLRDNNIYVDGSDANMLYFGVRQYAPEFELSASTVTEEQSHSKDFSYEGNLVNYAQYAISENSEYLQREYEKIGYVVIGDNEDYTIYRNNLDLTFYILRHGETIANRENRVLGAARNEYDALTEKGIEQARTSGAALSDVSFARAYSSPFVRTVDTCAQALDAAGQSSVEIMQNDALADIGWGAAEGMTWDEIHQIYGEDITLDDIFGLPEVGDYRGPIENASNRFQYMSAITSGMSSVLTESAVRGDDDANVMVVTHSAFAWWLQKQFPTGEVPDGLQNAGVTILKFHQGHWKLIAVDETSPDDIRQSIAHMTKEDESAQ